MAGDAVAEVGVLLMGKIQIVQEDIFGNRTIIDQLTAGHLFAETFICAGIKKSPVTVLTITECEILLIKFRQIITTCSSACEFHTKLIENMLQILARKNMILNQKNKFLSQRSTREKIRAYFMHMIAQQGKFNFDIPFSRSELADYLCVDRSALSRELGKLQDEGKIKFHKNAFEVLDLE